ncbi:hypothetical protein [Lapillicoccus jejuensis]|uniref:Uncharacterized protein n=1 Tax=Lapillicoccus jejuensis TaxID=402171 RepID=A0A542E2W3_9MICO|nr:hypothetical protein [Lapillicoccus jejuensis]TQJ09678.1 hypothetical protein FB458_2791 [Lapillicoccus jejuensis]
MSGAAAVRRSTRPRRLVAALLGTTLAVLGGAGASLASAAPSLSSAPTVAPAAAAAPRTPGSVTLTVLSLKTMAGDPSATPPRPAAVAGQPIGEGYHWMVNEDDTGDPGTAAARGTQACLPHQAPGGAVSSGADLVTDCPWPSIRATNGWAKVVAQGTEADLDASKALSLPGGKYLISVTADGFKIAGAHFTVDGGSTPQPVNVRMLPTPLPLATLKIQVFDDLAPVDATYEADAEPGLPGFVASLSDVFGRVSTDYYGNPLCTPYLIDPTTHGLQYDAHDRPVVDAAHDTGRCTSDAQGVITIPNLGEDRYAALVSPPVGQQSQWAETTTLEGGHDTDIWVQAGDSGLDNEVMKGAEPVPATQFGFVRIGSTLKAGATGHVKGHVSAQLPYIAGSGGQPGPAEGIAVGAKLGTPIRNPWVALSDLNNGDQQVYVGSGNADGTFDIAGVPDGSYQLTAWDLDQDYILNSINVAVEGGQAVDVGLVPLTGWFTHVYGTVYVDSNGNGKQDPGEPGVPQFPLTVRERDNSTMDQGMNAVTTDDQGHYDIRETYPLGKFLVLEAFDTRYRTSGITYQGENDPKPTTIQGGLVDFDFLPIIGLGGKVDWGVTPFAKTENGGIAGTVTYDTTRNELDPKDAVTEAYQPGIPGLQVDLFKPVPCPADGSAACSADGRYEIGADGAYVRSTTTPLQTYTTEGWNAPKGCTARMWNGVPLSTTDQQALPDPQGDGSITCLEAPMAGVAMGAGDASDPTDASTAVNGNYGFGGLDAGDYIVSVEIPDDPSGPRTPMYKVTSEEDVNVFTGDDYVAQQDYANATRGGGHTADPPNATALPSQPPSQQAGIMSSCVGRTHQVHVTDPDFLNAGGSPFEGQERPSCQDKLVTVRNGQTVAPNFNLFTTVPMPTHFWGLTLNDLGLSLDRTSANYGEAQGMPYVPVGLYDFAGNLVDTTHTDYNGLYEALEPSTGSYNCPVPAGPCPGMYRFVGNDPGGQAGPDVPATPNPDYNPRFRTIAANFQAWPGLYTVTDEAPTQVASTVLLPDTTPAGITACDLPTSYPQLFSVDKPVVALGGATATTDAVRTVTVKGLHLGSTPGTVTLTDTTVATPVPVTATVVPGSWSDTQLSFVVPATATPADPLQLTITRSGAGGASTVNGLTLQTVRTTTGAGTAAGNPKVYAVGTAAGQYRTIQSAVTAAEKALGTAPYALVVVYPGAQTALTPRGEYNENVIVDSRIHVQGVGPGGFQGSTWVPGSIIDGSGFSPDNAQGTAWLNTLASEPAYQGDPAVPDAAVVTFLAPARDTSRANAGWRASLDGFQVTGGIQSDTIIAPDAVTGANTTPYGAAGALVTQGGGVYVHAGVNGLRLTDNLVTGNGGSYGGGIRVGTPYVPGNHNYGVVIAHNQVRDNGGTNLAGGIGLFQGSNGYSVTDNTICGNHSSEYGGGLTAFGYMGSTARTPANNGDVVTGFSGSAQGGEIRRNRIWFNQSYDEGGGVMIAGELPATPDAVSPGSGPVVIDRNTIEANLANDDGGGIRLLQVSGSSTRPGNLGRISITDDTVVDNVSAHEGGGISLDDALFVDVVDTTVAKNITTATAVTSDGTPAAAGLTTGAVSVPLQASVDRAFAGPRTFRSLTTGRTTVQYTTNDRLVSTRRYSGDLGQPTSNWLGFGSPTLLDDVFYDNRAGTWSGGKVWGITSGDPADPVDTWDLQVVDQAAGATAATRLTATGTVLDDAVHSPSYLSGASTVTQTTTSPFAGDYTVGVHILTNRANPQFRMASVVTANLDLTTLGDYHLSGPGSPAVGQGKASVPVRWGDEPSTVPGSTPATGTPSSVAYTVSAAPVDVDGDRRPSTGTTRYDAGSDQLP